jgi:HEPN domain-containing protein
VNRKDFQALAVLRLAEAAALLDGGHYDGAYYLCGYVVECALKACIARQTTIHEFPDKEKAMACYTHDLSKLLKTAGIEPQLKAETKANPFFDIYWAIVLGWNEKSRYARYTAQQANALYTAVSDKRNGVLRWVKRNW